MDHHVFISYHHSRLAVAKKIVKQLEKDGIKCWCAPRDVVGPYASCIVKAIKVAQFFVLLLDGKSSHSHHVLDEIEIAYKCLIQDDDACVIMPIRLDKEELSDDMQYYINRIHQIDASNHNLDKAIESLKNNIKAIMNPYKRKGPTQRKATVFYKNTSAVELKRLRVQNRFLHIFDGDIFKNTIKKINQPHILDVGTNDGTYIMEALNETSGYNSFLGIDFNKHTIAQAKQRYANQKTDFRLADVEEPKQLEKVLTRYLAEKKLTGFNLINISMVLLHLKNPETTLKILNKYLLPGGYIIIKDVDDTHEEAFPDNDNLFEKLKELSLDDHYSGCRLSGRQIPVALKNANFKDIHIAKVGLSTLDLNLNDRDAFFHMCFSYFEFNHEMRVRDNPKDRNARKNLQWIKENYATLNEQFLEPSFYFMLGLMLFIARK